MFPTRGKGKQRPSERLLGVERRLALHVYIKVQTVKTGVGGLHSFRSGVDCLRLFFGLAGSAYFDAPGLFCFFRNLADIP